MERFGISNRKSKMNIALVSIYSTPAIGLRYISSVLKNNGFNVYIIFFKDKALDFDIMSPPDEKEYDLLVDLLRTLKIDLLGVSLRSSFFNIATTITREVQKNLSIPVIWGGTHPTIAPEDCIQVADMVCVGEGEYPILELAQAIDNNHAISNIHSIWIKEDGKVKKNSIMPLLQDLDRLPFPDYSKAGKFVIENNKISSGDPYLQTYCLDVLSSRGCPYNCSYCCGSVFKEIYKNKGPIVRKRSVQNVIDEIQFERDKFPHLMRIDFIDEVFAWDKKWASEFKGHYKTKVSLPFHCFQHPNMTDKEILTLLKEAGLERVEIGIQTGSERVRKDIFDRPISNKKLIEIGHLLKELKIIPFYDFIVDNPFETQEDKKKDLELLLELPRPFHLRMFNLTFFPRTKITEKALEDGYIDPNDIEGQSEKTFNQYFLSLRYPRSDSNKFWNSLMSLTSKGFIPKKFIRFLSSSKFLQKYPAYLEYFADLCNTIKLATIAIKWLFEGKPVFETLRKRPKGKSSPII